MIPSTILLFNGLHFPVDAIDLAIAWAQKTNSSLSALFIVADKDQDEGYPFPNDLAEAEDGPGEDEKAAGQDLAIIFSTIRLIRRQSAFAKIALRTQIVAAPKQETLHKLLADAGQVFIAENELDPAVLSVPHSRIEEALEGLSADIEWVV